VGALTAAPAGADPKRTAGFTSAALIGFAANSLFCRAALVSRSIDAGSFTFVRLVAGALALAAISRTRGLRGPAGTSFVPALALFVYAVAFSFGYLRLTTGTGALILFGAVQLTMVAAGVHAGERPRPAAWLGMAVAVGGLAALTFPGLEAPDPLGASLMAASGIAWGVYSLRGRGVPDPLSMTARNFALGAALAALPWLFSATTGTAHANSSGIALAIASGAIASGVGYSLWYAALRGLRTTWAAVVQLSVPVLAAASAVAFLGEPISMRLALSGAAILGGIAIVFGAK
jgi:drug/metabolite transporter (DMT)-like permease